MNKINISSIKLGSQFGYRTLLFLGLILTIILFSSIIVSAYSVKDFSVDSKKATDKTAYGTIAISERAWYDVFGWMDEKVKDVTLKSNTEKCSNDCEEIQEQVLYKDGALVEDTRYYRILDNGDKVLSNIRSEKFYIQDGKEITNEPVFEWTCKETGVTSKNGTKEQKCSNEEIGLRQVDTPIWKEYKIGEVVKAGTYIVKHTGEKRADWSYDWQIKTNGVWSTEWATWGSSTLVNGLVAYWTFNSTFNETIYGARNWTPHNTVIDSSGKISGGKNVTSSSGVCSYLDMATGNIVGDGAFSISYWMKSYRQGGSYMRYFNLDRTSGSFIMLDDGTNFKFGFDNESSHAVQYTMNADLWDGRWIHVVIVYDGGMTDNVSAYSLYLNGTLYTAGKTGTTVGNAAASINSFGISSNGNEGDYLACYTGTLDETAFYNRTLTASEVTQLYNSNAGKTYSQFSGSLITQNSPADSYSTNSATTNFNCTATMSGATFVNMSLYTNKTGSWARANTTTTNGGTMSLLFTDGTYKWGCYACDSDGDCGWSGNRTIIIDSTAPGVTVAYPTGTINYGYVGQNISLNYSITDANIGTCSLVYTPNANVTGEDSLSQVGDGNYNLLGYIYVANNITQKYYVTSPLISDVVGDVRIYNGIYISGTYQNFQTDGLNESVAINVPNGWHVVTWRGSQFGGKNATLDKFNIDNSTYVLQSSTIPCNANSSLILGTTKSLGIFANDTDGNTNSTIKSWDYKLFSGSQTYSLNTIEGAYENFIFNFTTNASYQVSSGYLVYNGTSYLGSSGINGVSKSITIPNIVSNTNLSFYWSITLEDGTNINTTETNQSVSNLGIDDCSVFTNKLFNITIYDEDEQYKVNGVTDSSSIKIDFTISNSANTLVLLNYSKLFNNTNPAFLCVQNNLTSSNLRLDGVIEYTSNGRFIERYNFQNYVLNNNITNLPIKLYDLNSTKGQEFKITYKDSNFVPVSGAIFNIQRKYVDEGLFKTIEIPKSGTDGYTIGHLIRNDVVYNILIYKEGVLLATFLDVIAECQNPTLSSCQINLNSYGSSTMPEKFSTNNDVSFVFTYNKTTRSISTVFAILSGATKTVTLNVTLFDALGNLTVCSDSLFASGGQLDCTVPTSFGNGTVIAKLYKEGTLIGQSVLKLWDNPRNIYGTSIIFIALIGMLFFVGIGISDNPMIMGGMLLLGSIVLIAVNLVYSPSWIGIGATILWFVISIVIILIKGANRQ